MYLNSLFPSITFTVEKEQDGTLPFMDVLVSRLVDSSMMTSVYRKPTHTDSYLSYNSNHPPHVKEERSYQVALEQSQRYFSTVHSW